MDLEVITETPPDSKVNLEPNRTEKKHNNAINCFNLLSASDSLPQSQKKASSDLLSDRPSIVGPHSERSDEGRIIVPRRGARNASRWPE